VSDARRAVGLSALAGLALTAGTVAGLVFADRSWTTIPFLLGGIGVVFALQAAARDIALYRDHVAATRQTTPRFLNRDPVAASRGYLRFQARRAGWAPTAVIAAVWTAWAFPVGLFVFLLVNAVVEVVGSLAG
jgi:hypothetical protein